MKVVVDDTSMVSTVLETVSILSCLPGPQEAEQEVQEPQEDQRHSRELSEG